MKTYFVFDIIAYVKRLENGNFDDAIRLQVIADNQDQAVEKAKKIVEKPFYYLSAVIEKNVGT